MNGREAFPMRTYKRLALLLLTLALIISWFHVILLSPPINGRVVDGTGQPIAGAVVVADWAVHASLSNAPIGQLKMFEVVTDSEGRFHIPSWGMEAVVKGVPQQAVVRIFHPDYVPLVLDDALDPGLGLLVATFPRNGDTFVLEALRLGPEERNERFARLYESLFGLSEGVKVGGNCPKLSMPRMLAAMDKAPLNFINGNIPGLPLIPFHAGDVENRVPCHFDGGATLQP